MSMISSKDSCKLTISIPIKNRKPFGNPSIPFLLKPYAWIADPSFQKSLSKFKMTRIANAFWKILFQIGRNQKGSFSFTDNAKKAHAIEFRSGNSQFISIYLKYFREHGYEPEVTALLDALSDSQTVFYDIGSNWGFHSLYLASKANFKGKIFAFEPVPETYRDLCSVVEQANASIECVNLALSNSEGSRFMEYPGFLKALSGLAKFSNANRGFEVKTSTLDRLNFKKPDIIKLDVEGAEIEVLSGGKETILSSKPMIIFENFYSHEERGSSLEVLRVLKELGYSFFQPFEQQNALSLSEFKIEERPQMPGSNFLACHQDRISKLKGLV